MDDYKKYYYERFNNDLVQKSTHYYLLLPLDLSGSKNKGCNWNLSISVEL